MNNPPAFPYAFQHEDDTRFIAQGFSPGMSLRDYFAGQCLINLSHPDVVKVAGVAPACIAQTAYELADAMMAERAKANKPS